VQQLSHHAGEKGWLPNEKQKPGLKQIIVKTFSQDMLARVTKLIRHAAKVIS